MERTKSKKNGLNASLWWGEPVGGKEDHDGRVVPLLDLSMIPDRALLFGGHLLETDSWTVKVQRRRLLG